VERRIQQALEALSRSDFRSRFRLTDQDRRTVHERGLDTIRDHALTFVHDRIAPAFPPKDGRQTPWRGHPVFVAQHATATCCRRCLQKWHRIAKGAPLTRSEIEFVTALIMRWIEVQTTAD